MRRVEGVVRAFAAARKTAQAALLAQGRHALAPPGENLGRIGLVAHVPDQPVFGGMEYIVQRHGELDGSQIGAKVSAGLGYGVQQKGAQFVGQRAQLRAR